MHGECCSPIAEGSPAAAYSRIVDDVELLSFLEGEVIFGASVIVIQRYEEGDSTTCRPDKAGVCWLREYIFLFLFQTI